MTDAQGHKAYVNVGALFSTVPTPVLSSVPSLGSRLLTLTPSSAPTRRGPPLVAGCRCGSAFFAPNPANKRSAVMGVGGEIHLEM